MARVAAQTGIAPQLLLELDVDVWTALVQAVDTRWTQLEEMATFQAELLHELIRVTLGIHGNRMTQPLRLPRPDTLEQPAAGRLSSPEQVAEFVLALGGAIRG